jgi:hypothetical protein
MAWRRRTLVVAALALLTLALGAAGARGQGVPPATGALPADGEWLGVTNGGYTMGFTVAGGQITKLHFGIDAGGSCGAGEATEELAEHPPQIEPDGSWYFTGALFEFVEGVFVSPERTEGRIVTPGRSLPSCPYTEVNFAAELGRVPTDVKPEVLALRHRGARHAELRPNLILAKHGLSFYRLKWKDFGERVTTAKGKAGLSVHGHRHVWKVTARLSRPVLQPAGYEVYSTIAYTLRGPIEPGLSVRRHAVIDML